MLTVDSLSKFAYTLREGDEPRATVRLPTWPARARNARLAVGPSGHVEIEAAGVSYRVEYERFDAPGMGPRLDRFELLRGETVRATATAQRGRPRSWRIGAPGIDARLVEQRRFGAGLRFDLEDDARRGGIRESTRFLALRRRFEVDLPTVDDLALRAFLFFVAVNATYR